MTIDPAAVWALSVVVSQIIGIFLWRAYLKKHFSSIDLLCVEAEVLHSKTFSETSLSTNTTSTGGGGYVSPSHGGYISSPSVQTSTTSTSTKVDQLFLKFGTGNERSFEFRNSPVLVRPGTKLSCVVAGGANDGKILAMRNDQTGVFGVMREAPMAAFGFRLPLAIFGPLEAAIFAFPMLANALSDADSADKGLVFLFLLIGLTIAGAIVWGLRGIILTGIAKRMISKRTQLLIGAKS